MISNKLLSFSNVYNNSSRFRNNSNNDDENSRGRGQEPGSSPRNTTPNNAADLHDVSFYRKSISVFLYYEFILVCLHFLPKTPSAESLHRHKLILSSYDVHFSNTV